MCVLPGLHAPRGWPGCPCVCASAAPASRSHPRRARQPGLLPVPCCFWVSATGKTDTCCSSTQSFLYGIHGVFNGSNSFSSYHFVCLFTVVSVTEICLFLFRGTFPLVLHNCHTLKHLYAQVCSVNYILKLLNAQPFS